jgi:uncharacterized protein DUF4410
MKITRYIMLCLFTLMLSDVYASTKITDRDEIVHGEIPKPAHIWVYDFFTSASDIPAESALAGQHSDNDTPQTASQVSAGRKLGAEIGTELIKQFKAMGLQADRATGETELQLNDVAIQGYLVSEVAGSQKKRVMLGFGAGESELKAVVEGFQNTASGLQALGSAKTDSTEGLPGKTPGMAVGIISTVAMHNPLGLIVSTGENARGKVRWRNARGQSHGYRQENRRYAQKALRGIGLDREN